MTSWSLTVLFIHLWISAFISLYFYSINEKSRLNVIFSYLFGPFSCSRPVSTRPASCCLINPFKKILISSPKSPKVKPKSSNIENIEQTKTNLLNLNAAVNVENELTGQQSNNNSNNNNNNNIVIYTEQNTQLTDAGNVVSTVNIRTYCDNKALCNMPSSIVISNAESWKLWIDTHVPSFILVLIKISWLLNNIVAISALIVTVVYFSYAYLSDLEAEPTWAHELGNVHRHGINSIVALIDVVLLAYPIRILHFVYVNIYGWLYAFVNLFVKLAQ